MRQRQRVSAAVLAAVSVFAAGSFAEDKRKDPNEIGNRDVGRGVNFYSLEKEIALGRELAQEVQWQSRVINDSVIAEYINRIGQNLVRNSDAKVPFTIKVLDSEEVNASALPGGFLFVNSGLILRAESEAELAGVMAHEIAHVAARHATRQATRATIATYATIPLIFLGGWSGYAIRQAAGFAVPLSFLRFSRGFERQADFLGLQCLYKAGYDPTAFVDFFEKIQTLEKRHPGTVARAFSTHPLTKDRIRASQKEIQEILTAQPQYVVTTSEFNEVKSRLEALYGSGRNSNHGDQPILNRRRASGPNDKRGAAESQLDDDGPPRLKRSRTANQ